MGGSWPGSLVRAGLLGRGVTGGGTDKGDALLLWRSRALLHHTTAWLPEPTSGSAPVWFWAARQASAPAGMPSGVGAGWLQLTRLRVWQCRPSPFAQTGTASIPPTAVRLGPLESAMQEILFLVEEAEDGSFRASAAAAAIHTEADTMEDLHREIRDAVVCHFDPGQAPPLIRLHHVRQELLAL
jgi:hypothetical protein